MANPRRVNISVPGTTYHLEVDLAKRDCKRERAHCHVCNGSKRVAQVWISSCLFAEVPREISYNDQRRILYAVDEHSNELWGAYEHNRKYGAD